MMTVGAAAKTFGISRTALLYYEKIGLICPSKRADNGYRMYSKDDIGRLKVVMSLRGAGISLTDIRQHLEQQVSDVSSMLLRRLSELNAEIQNIKEQQAVIIKLLGSHDLRSKRLDRQTWKRILSEAGIDNETTLKWHLSFEKQSPERHTALLKMLGFTDEEIASFREEYSQD